MIDSEVEQAIKLYSELQGQLQEARDNYVLANQRIIELLEEKMALKETLGSLHSLWLKDREENAEYFRREAQAERQRDELAAALDAARRELDNLRHPLARRLADPAAILAERERPLRNALVNAARELLSYDASYGGGGGESSAFEIARLLGYDDAMSANEVEVWLFAQEQSLAVAEAQP